MAVGTYGAGTSTFRQVKQAFFDPSKVIKGMDRASARALSKFGAFVRTRARTSIRYRKDAAAPGQPPSAHKSGMRTKTNRKTGVTKRQPSSPLRDNIYFYYDRETKSVIIGPTLTTGQSARGGRPQGKTVPETLEKGGRVVLPRGRAGRTRTVTVREHPFMHPAEAAERPKLVGFFQNSL